MIHFRRTNKTAILKTVVQNGRILNSNEQISPILTCMNNLNNETKSMIHEYLKE